MRGFCRVRSWTDKMRVHPVYILQQVRHPLDRTVSMQAEKRTTELRRGSIGGSWTGNTGDGEAWLYAQGGWLRADHFVRAIRGGQWHGPWRREMDV